MHTRGEGVGGGTLCTSIKDFEKLDLENAIKHENRGPLPDFLTTPSTPSKELENEFESMTPTGHNRL
jgi:hypothetical protein